MIRHESTVAVHTHTHTHTHTQYNLIDKNIRLKSFINSTLNQR